ncbi:MAG: GNAT family N-acetyltransferase, partial [Phenylobacterium sp.]
MPTSPPWFPIRTERLLLREFRESDLDDTHAYAIDPEVVRYMEWGPNTPAETRAFLDRQLADNAEWPRPGVTLAVEHVADARMIGSTRLLVSDPANRTGDFGYSYHSAYWRQGYGTEVGRAILDAAFRALGLHRMWAECDVQNVGSYGVMRKLGMRREAHTLASKLVKGA